MGLRKMSLVKRSWGDFPVGGIEAGSSKKRGSSDEGVRGGQERTASGHQRSEGPQRMWGGWRAETLGVSSRSASLPDQVWVWAPAGARGESGMFVEKDAGITGVHQG